MEYDINHDEREIDYNTMVDEKMKIEKQADIFNKNSKIKNKEEI